MLSTERVSAVVNLGNIKHNIEEAAKRIPESTGIMAVIKAD